MRVSAGRADARAARRILPKAGATCAIARVSGPHVRRPCVVVGEDAVAVHEMVELLLNCTHNIGQHDEIELAAEQDDRCVVQILRIVDEALTKAPPRVAHGSVDVEPAVVALPCGGGCQSTEHWVSKGGERQAREGGGEPEVEGSRRADAQSLSG